MSVYGRFYLFEEFTKDLGNGLHNLGSDSYKIGLVTTLPVVTAAAPSFTDWTEVSGTNYTAGGEAVTTTWTEVAGVGSFKITDTSPAVEWLRHASGPTNVRAGILYNSTNAAKEAIGFIDMTLDSTTISLVDADISWSLLFVDAVFTLGGER